MNTIMKKIVYLFVLAFLFASCEKEDVGGTAIHDMAGQWYVHVDAVDENGDLVYSDDDLFGMGNFLILTYNTSDNSSDKMFVDDLESFWDFKVKTSCNLNDKSFGEDEFAENLKYECGVKITEGSIMYGAATTPSGMPADSIVMYVEFDDDYTEVDADVFEYTPDLYGFAKYRISGYRYTGFALDD